MLNKILSVVIVVMVTCSLVVQAKTSEEDVNLKKGLVLYMSLDEGKGASATDVSTNELEGAVKGKAKWIDGKFGKSLSCLVVTRLFLVQGKVVVDVILVLVMV